MTDIEKENEDLRGIQPKNYTAFDKPLLTELLKSFNSIPMDIEGDAFGKIAEQRNLTQASKIFDYQSTKQKDPSPTQCKTTLQPHFLSCLCSFAPETNLSVKQTYDNESNS
jgi:hypothetical protein